MIGEDLQAVANGDAKNRDNEIFAQISESRVGRCIRTADYLYSVYAPATDGIACWESDIYEEDFLYDLKADPFELHNVIHDAGYESICAELKIKLGKHMERAGERIPTIISVMKK